MANFDAKAIVNTPNYSRINLTFESIGTLQMGLGTPVLHKVVIPGDDMSLSVDQIMRLAPLSTPVFDDVSLHFRAFFVPNRILDPRWKEFLTAGIGLHGSSDNEISPLTFTLRSLVSYPDEVRSNSVSDIGTYAASVGGLADWLNFHFAKYADDELQRPQNYTGIEDLEYDNTPAAKFNFLPFLGYYKIYDDWYRNERVQPEMLPPIISYLQNDSPDERCFDNRAVDSGGSIVSNINPFKMWRVNYGKDRYTTGLPEPVIGGDISAISGDATVRSGSFSSNSTVSSSESDGLRGFPATLTAIDNTSTTLFVNLASAAENTIRNLKAAFKMYDFFMKDTYGGNRYVEFMQNHFNVRVPDATLDRAIYLGDHKVRVSFGEVFQTSQGSGDSNTGKLGDYAGRGAAYSGDGFIFNEKFLEHGQLYVIASIVPRAKYFQGIDRKFFVKDRFDFFFPEFQNIGDDALFKAELFNTPTVPNPNDPFYNDVFAYAPRWSHLKESLDEVHGDFLTNMDNYHFGRRFLTVPILGSKFSEIPTINDPFSVTDSFSENFLINMRWNLSAARPIQMYDVF